MANRIILLSGHVSSGKSTLANGLAGRYGMIIFKTRDILKERIKQASGNRRALQSEGDRLDKRTRGKWVVDELVRWLRTTSSNSPAIVDSVRTVDQIEAIRNAFGTRVIHVHLNTPITELEKRYKLRQKVQTEGTNGYSDVLQNVTEQQVDKLARIADVVVDTKMCTQEDVLVRVSGYLKLIPKGSGYVDVLVGGQYGSEGKGNISAYLAHEYDLLVRVGGPNAGHKVYEEPKPYTHHQLPSGTRRCEVPLLIGPGATIDIKKLLKEIAECEVSADRLHIDPNTMVISDEDIALENEGADTIGSTKQGVGAAMARRIYGRLQPNTPLLAGDIPELKPYLSSALKILTDTFSRNGHVLLEGTQGTGLSLYHGPYPHVTSRDTTVSGCLAEVGIPPNRVRRVIMVCRTYPIRVKSPEGGTSGPMSQQTTYEEISRRSGKDVNELRRTEMTSTTYRQRRIGEFEWDLLLKSTLLNGPTDIALTFVDYISKRNEKAWRFEQLSPETIYFIEEIERIAGVPVSLISTGFNPRSIIDRRSW